MNVVLPLFLSVFILTIAPLAGQSAIPPAQKKQHAKVYYKQAQTLWRANELDSVLIYYGKAKGLLFEAEAWLPYINVLNRMARFHYIFDPTSAIAAYAQEAIKVNQSKLAEINRTALGTSYYYWGQYAYIASDYALADSVFRLSLENRRQALGAEHSVVGDVYYALGQVSIGLGHLDEAEESFRQAGRIYRLDRKNWVVNQTAIFEGLADTHALRGDPLRQIAALDSSLILTEKYNLTGQNTAIVYMKKGLALHDLGDFEMARALYNKAISIVTQEASSRAALLSELYILRGKNDLEMERYQQALHSFATAKQFVSEAIEESRYDYGLIHSNLAIVYQRLGEYEKSIRHFELADRHLASRQGIFLALRSENQLKYADLLIELERLDAAELAIRNGLEYLNKYYQKGHFSYSELYNRLAQIYSRRDAHVQADSAISFAFHYNGFDHRKKSEKPNLRDIPSPLYLFESLVIQAEINLRKAKRAPSESQSLLNSVLFGSYQAIFVLDELRRNYQGITTKNLLNKKAVILFDQAIEAAILMAGISDQQTAYASAFAFAELSKNSILRDALVLAESQKFANVPDSLLAMEKDLRIDITYYQTQLWKEQNAAKQKPGSIRYFEEKLLETQKQYQHLLGRLQEDFKEYYRLKYSADNYSMKTLQTELIGSNEALLQYYFSLSKLYVFALTQDTIIIQELSGLPEISDFILAFRKSIDNVQFIMDSTKAADALFVSAATALYDRLLKPVIGHLPASVNQLKIIPDGELGYLNFEALLTAQPAAAAFPLDYSKLSYLALDYSISYAYSANVLVSEMATKQAPTKRFAGYAPRYEKTVPEQHEESWFAALTRSGYYDLPGARQEVENLARLTGGDAFLDEQANEKHFKQNAGDYQILHLAMHGILDDQNSLYSKLLFSQSDDSLEDGRLHAAEIFNLELAADLVVLSACNSGFGRIHRGEGIMSLSRAFKYAGVPSLVMSLWQLPDQQTKTIIEQFYANLMDGQAKDAALRNSKLAYLAANQGQLQAHPYFWAGQIAIGDMRPLSGQQNWPYYMLGLSLFLLVLVFILRSRRKAA
jgi:CHAT domain-containing protein